MSLLGALSLVLPSSPIEVVRRATGPNRYAPRLASQQAIAATQVLRNTIRAGLSGLSGSEQDFAQEQSAGSSALGAPLEQFIPSARRPTHAYVPNVSEDLVVGAGTGPYAGSSFKGWVVLAGRKTWGASSRALAPHVIPNTLLDPTSRSPLPQDVVAAHDKANAGNLRLQDYFGG